MAETVTRTRINAREPSTPCHDVHRPHTPRRRTRRLVALALASTAVLGACAGEAGDDLSPVEPEAGEHDTEVVPGEEGPVE
ncbi:MAG TPA: hypothetical protein VGR26_03890 [Acidimicrobiales bacterium]|nr:hypothetical protein [Acidimicrobiales bacterium]